MPILFGSFFLLYHSFRVIEVDRVEIFRLVADEINVAVVQSAKFNFIEVRPKLYNLVVL